MTRARQKILLTYRNYVTDRKFKLTRAYPSNFLKRLPGHVEFCKYTSKSDIERYGKIAAKEKEKAKVKAISSSTQKARKKGVIIANKQLGTSISTPNMKKKKHKWIELDLL